MRYLLIILILAIPAIAQDAIDANESKMLSNAFHRGDAPAKVKQWFRQNTGPGEYFATPQDGRAAMRSLFRALVPRPAKVTTRQVDEVTNRSEQGMKRLPINEVVAYNGASPITAGQLDAWLKAGADARRLVRTDNVAAHEAAEQAILDAQAVLDAATGATSIADAQAALDAAVAARDALPVLE